MTFDVEGTRQVAIDELTYAIGYARVLPLKYKKLQSWTDELEIHLQNALTDAEKLTRENTLLRDALDEIANGELLEITKLSVNGREIARNTLVRLGT